MADAWINHPLILIGQTIDLLSLEETHFDILFESTADERIWKFYPYDCSDRNKFNSIYREAIMERENGNHYPFVILHRQTGRLIGSTSLYNIHPNDKNVEIGWTWLHPDYWGTDVNLESKLLLLKYCFDILKCVRVQLRANDLNFRSQKAIQKIGGKFEGILRKSKIKEDGTIRNVVYFSIIDEEWNFVQQDLIAQIEKKQKEK